MISRIMDRLRIYRHRRAIQSLINRGLQIGQDVNIMPEVHFDHSYPHLIKVGNNCSISWGARILAHDASAYSFTNCARVGRVEIRDHTFIAERTLILPGVKIGPKALVAAGSVVTRDVPPNTRVIGNPARKYGTFDDFIEEVTHAREQSLTVDFKDICGRLTDDEKDSMWRETQDGILYVLGFVGDFPYVFNPSGIPPEKRFEAYPVAKDLEVPGPPE